MELNTATTTHRKQRINAAIDCVFDHPAEHHSLESMAAKAHYSPFHFLRSFRALTKQTPMQFLLNQRLDRAARMLIYNKQMRVTDIGSSCGFTSSQHLSKAFRSAYGLSPRDVSGNLGFLHDRTSMPIAVNRFEAKSSTGVRWSSRDIEVIRLPDYRVAYFRTIGPYGPQLLEEWFDRMAQWIGEYTPLSMMFGIPRSLPGITPDWRCVHEVCGVFENDLKLAPGMGEQRLGGGLTAVFRAEVSYAHLYIDCRKIWTWLTHCWLPASPFQPDDRPAFEVYRRNLQGNPSHGIEFCLPIRPREDRMW